jgi:hypothetical protein
VRTLAPPKLQRLLVGGFFVVATIATLFMQATPAAAACTMPSPDYGTINASISIPTTATYRVWTRMMVPDTTNKSYLLEIDGNQCFTVGDGGFNANTWTWVDYQNGTSSSKIDLNLTQGTHTLRMIGSKPNVAIDRVVATANLTCTPTGTGDNCDTPTDTTAPSVSLTAPAQNSTVSGAVNVTANASDNTGVSKVEFYDNSTIISTATTAPYSVSWNTAGVSNGTHTLTAKAYDAAGNNATSGYTVTVQNNDTTTLTHPDGSLIRPQNGTAIYLLVGGQRQQIGSPGVFSSQGFDPSKVLPALAADLNLPKTTSDVYFREGILLQGSGPPIYVIDYNNGAPRKRHITDPAVMSALGYDNSDVVHVGDNELPAANGPDINTPTQHPDGTVFIASNNRDLFLIDNGQKRYIGLPQIFQSQNFRGFKKGTTADNNLAQASNVYFREGALIKDTTPPVYIVDDNNGTFQKRHIISPDIFLKLGWSSVQNDVFVVPVDAIPTANGSPLQ